MSRGVAGGALTLGSSCQRQDACVVSYDIRVPRTMTVLVTNRTGDIKLSSLAGVVTASSALGTITATGLESTTADFNSQLGRIDAAFTAVPTEVDATTGDGSVSIRVPGTVSYCVTTQTGGAGAANVTVRRDSASPHIIVVTTQTGPITVAPV